MIRYVLGLAFMPDNSVVMVRKNRPDWQAGKLNFVGGKVEEGEEPPHAMVREFREETGVEQPLWEQFGTMSSGDFHIDVFVGIVLEGTPMTVTDEEILLISEDQFTISSERRKSFTGNVETLWHFVHSNDFLNMGATLHINFPARDEH